MIEAVPSLTLFSKRSTRFDATCAYGVSLVICSTLALNSSRSFSSWISSRNRSIAACCLRSVHGKAAPQWMQNAANLNDRVSDQNSES